MSAITLHLAVGGSQNCYTHFRAERAKHDHDLHLPPIVEFSSSLAVNEGLKSAQRDIRLKLGACDHLNSITLSVGCKPSSIHDLRCVWNQHPVDCTISARGEFSDVTFFKPLTAGENNQVEIVFTSPVNSRAIADSQFRLLSDFLIADSVIESAKVEWRLPSSVRISHTEPAIGLAGGNGVTGSHLRPYEPLVYTAVAVAA